MCLAFVVKDEVLLFFFPGDHQLSKARIVLYTVLYRRTFLPCCSRNYYTERLEICHDYYRHRHYKIICIYMSMEQMGLSFSSHFHRWKRADMWKK